MKTYLLTCMASMGALFAGVTAGPIQTPPMQFAESAEQEPEQAPPASVQPVSILIPEVEQEQPQEPQQSQQIPTPPLVDTASIERKLDALAAKIDELASKPGPVQAAFPTADEIAFRVSERVAEKVVDKVADKVVEKIKNLLVSFRSSDGSTRSAPVAVSPISGSQAFSLAPGEVLTHIDGVPVQQTAAAAVSQAGWIPTQSPVYETPMFQVMQAAPNQVRILPRFRQAAPSGRCRVVNGQVVCN